MKFGRFVVSSMGVVGALSLAGVGCKESDRDEEEAAAVTTSALQAQSQAGLMDGLVDVEGELAPNAEDAAKAVVERPLRGIRPEGCAKKTRAGEVVTLEMTRCTGPFGKVEITGSLVATFSNPSADVVHVDIAASEGTTANGEAFSYAATGELRFDGDRRFVTYHGSSSGTTKRGRDFATATDVSIVADVTTRCATMSGTSKGNVARYDLDLTLEGFEGCGDACPSAGTARARVDGPLVQNASVEVVFDGSATAKVKVERGEGRRTSNVDVAIDCDAAEAQ
ncbi:MAG: hypothetical protein KF782_01000 [Labilithrix sp.]|nr:hypothetical protein [Labilithrix sp.]